MTEYRSTKLFEGYSTAFRQWRAKHSHCQYIHGYALKFKVTFEGSLDELNWVCDFGCFKRNGIKEHMNFMFDHTTVVAKDDPELKMFEDLANKGLIQLRVLDHVGCEKFAQYVYDYINEKYQKKLTEELESKKVESFEGGTNNSAIYEPSKVRASINKRKLIALLIKLKHLHKYGKLLYR